LISVSIKLVSQSEFGLWMSISSFLGWVSFLDLGVGNGLRSTLSHFEGTEEFDKAKRVLSSVYVLLGKIFLVVTLVLIPLIWQVDWVAFFNMPDGSHQILRIVVLMTCISILMQIILKLIIPVLSSLHLIGLADLINAIGQVSIVAVLATFAFTDAKLSLLQLAFIQNVIPVAVLLIANVYVFTRLAPKLKPNLQLSQFSETKGVLSLGGQFLLLQVASFALIGSQSFVVGKLYTQVEVARFAIPQRYYSTIYIVWSILLSPLWAHIAEAHSRDDKQWLTRKLIYLYKWFFAFICLCSLSIFVAPFFYQIWVGEHYAFDLSVELATFFFFAVICFNATTNVFVNAIARTKAQITSSIIATLVSVYTCLHMSDIDLVVVDLAKVPLINGLCLLGSGIIVLLDFIFYLRKHKRV
jgi:O-antigen/teichoic acid export membrane protein